MRLIDVNGDGLIDIVYSRTGGQWPGSGVFLNTGTGWVKGPAQMTPPVAFTEDGLADVGVRPLDVNGDGLLDFIQFLSREDGSSDRAVWVNESGKPGLLSEVVTGLGYRVAVTYQSYLSFTPDRGFPARSDPAGGCGNSQSSCASQYPVIHALLPGYVVTRVETSGIGVERRSRAYSYAGYRVNTLSGRSLGFEFQDLLDEQRRQLTRSQYSQDEGLLGSLVATATSRRGQGPQPPLVVLGESRLTWEVRTSEGLPHPEASSGELPKIFRPLLSAQSAVSRDMGASVLSDQSDTFVHDGSGRLKEATTRFPNGASTVVRTQYKPDDVANWTLSRPSVVEREYRAPGQALARTRSRSEYLRDTYAPSLEVTLHGSPSEKRLSYVYDAFGNRTETATVADGGQRVQKSVFDQRGRFMRQVENALGHKIDIEYEQKSGVVTARSTLSGGMTRVEVDSLQRAYRETLPSGIVTLYSTGFVRGTGNADAVFFTQKQVGSLPPEATLADSLARTRAKVSYVALGGPVAPCVEFGWNPSNPTLAPVVTRQFYDPLGRMNRTSVPVRCGSSAAAEKTILFDELDRPTKITQADQTTQTLKYQGLRTIMTNSLGNKTTITRDIQGRNVEVVDALGGRTVMTYDSRGRLVGTTDALARAVSFDYDDAGNRTTVRDSVGEWKMKFDGFGDLVSQTDPRGSVITLGYDPLGRLRTREAGSHRSAWVYDACENGVGRLCSNSSSSGDSRAIVYDKAGRVASATVVVGSDSIVITPRYDLNGRVAEKSYSTGQLVKNGYNAAGAMDKVSIVAGGKETVLLEVREFDEVGRVRRESLGSIDRETRFRTNSNQIEGIQAGVSGMPALQNLKIQYDDAGNVISRADESVGWFEQFKYDELNRISRVGAEGVRDVSVKYDALGNIKSRSDVGGYNYCPSAQGQLCSVEGERTMKLAYDTAGNVTAMGDLRLRFDAEGKVASVAQGSDSIRTSYSEFAYGADGQLLIHESRQLAIKTKLSLLDEVEVLREDFAPPLFGSAERTRVRLNVTGPTGVIGFFETAYFHHPYQVVSPLYSHTVRLGRQRVTDAKDAFYYVLKDHLSSLVAVVDAVGKVTERFRFDPWGKRRQVDSRGRYTSISAGFTGHQQIDAFDLVHMGGRVYSALIGRFLSPDVMTQLPLNTQSYNRYSYVLNNPLKLIDPSGFDFFGDLWDSVTKPFRWAGEQLEKASRWVSANWQIIVIVVVAIAAPYALSAVWGLTNAIAIGAITGAAVGATSGALYGGTINDVLQGAAMGAITGAITGSVGYAYGESYGVSQPYSWGRVAAEGAAGGTVAHIRGGNFSEGFWFSAAMAAATYANQGIRKQVIEDSAQMDDLNQSNLAPPFTHSDGLFGDGYKLGGERLPELGGVCGGPAGGCQITRGYLGSANWTYDAGSWQDKLVESYAGPHDWISAPITYSSNGFQSASKIGAIPYLGTAVSGVLLVPATYFAMPAFIPIQAREEMRQRCSNAYGWCIY
jgi:RHS repeat-associated protein